MPLAFQPACQPLFSTGLPHTNVHAALALLRDVVPNVLVCSRLPQRSPREHLHLQSMHGFPGWVLGDSPTIMGGHVERSAMQPALNQLSLDYLQHHTGRAGLGAEDSAVLAEVLRHPPTPPVQLAIFQLAGPISLALQITDEQRRPLIYDDELLDALVQHLALRAAWLGARLQPAAAQVMIWLHESFLGALGTNFCPISHETALDIIEQVFLHAPTLRGLSITDLDGMATDKQQRLWQVALESQLDLIACTSASVPVLATLGPQLAAYLQAGGVIMWRIVPTESGEVVATTDLRQLHLSFRQIVEHLAVAGVAPELVRAQAFIGASTSIAHLSPEQATQVGQHCRTLAQMLGSEPPVHAVHAV